MNIFKWRVIRRRRTCFECLSERYWWVSLLMTEMPSNTRDRSPVMVSGKGNKHNMEPGKRRKLQSEVRGGFLCAKKIREKRRSWAGE